MTESIAEKLVKEGKVLLKRCRSERTGRHYDALIRVVHGEGGRAEFQMDFQNGGKKN